ncbi:hypothetical protein JW962_01635 [Candidatus Dojkabacteria bacterium]|nr:hypothetical protein [Candidatus Dojkabacteria bacterium]
MADIKQIRSFLLNEFGLSDTETVIYLGLLQKGISTVLEISRYTGVNRATVHLNIENLRQKGLVTQTKQGRGKRRQIIAEPPERLGDILAQRRLELETTKKNYDTMLSDLKALIPRVDENTSAEIKYYEGNQEVSYIYDEALKANEFRAYVNASELAKYFPANVPDFLERHKARTEMQIWEIMEMTPESIEYAKKMPKERYFYKFIPKGTSLSVIDYMIFDSKVAIVNLDRNTSGLIIQNHNLYENAKEVFKLMWGMLPEP